MSNNDCLDIFAMLSEYIDRELPRATCEELDRHIQNCAPCVEFVKSLRKSVALGQKYVPGGDPPPIPPGIREALREVYAKSLAERRETTESTPEPSAPA